MSPARSTRQSPGRAYAPARARKTATAASNEPRELPRDESHRTFFTHTLVAHRNQPHGTVRSSRQTAAHTVSILAHVPTADRLRPQGHTSQTMQTPCPPSQVLGNAQSTPRHLGQHRPVSGQHVRRPLASRNSVALPSAAGRKRPHWKPSRHTLGSSPKASRSQSTTRGGVSGPLATVPARSISMLSGFRSPTQYPAAWHKLTA